MMFGKENIEEALNIYPKTSSPTEQLSVRDKNANSTLLMIMMLSPNTTCSKQSQTSALCVPLWKVLGRAH